MLVRRITLTCCNVVSARRGDSFDKTTELGGVVRSGRGCGKIGTVSYRPRCSIVLFIRSGKHDMHFKITSSETLEMRDGGLFPEKTILQSAKDTLVITS